MIFDSVCSLSIDALWMLIYDLYSIFQDDNEEEEVN